MVLDAKEPTIQNIALAARDTEYSFLIAEKSGRYSFKLRDATVIAQYAFTAGETNTTFITLRAGSEVTQEKLSTDLGTTIYIRYLTSVSAQVLEVEEWGE